jgi:hypothetical protein
MKNLIYVALIVVLALNIGCTVEPVTTQENETTTQELQKVSIENDEVKDSDI